MRIKRYCGHEEVIKDPETKEKFLMERGRKCKKCRTIGPPKSREAIGEADLPRPMAMAMDAYRE